jgi:cell wall-associated NlpC family hydrolase
MEPPAPYSQVVDNASPGRFHSARDWKRGSKKSSRGAPRYDEDYRYVRPAKDAPPARFRLKIPAAGHYTLYARWTAARGNNPATRFWVSTASGPKKVEVNQRKDGGTWVRLGAYEMEAGDRSSVQVAGRSSARGRIVADTVRVVGGTQAPPRAREGKDGAAGEPAGSAGSGQRAPGGDVAVGAELVERARTHLGTPYRHSPPLPCQAYRSEDCSCLTSLVFDRWLTLPDNPIGQWHAGRGVEKSDLRPGDLVFFKEAGEGSPITHVAIYSGGGNIIHASTYWGRVVERPMKYVSGYYGAKRLS